MSETLRQKQSRFVRLLVRLIDHAHAMGYELTLGDAYRDPRLHGVMGERKSYSHPFSMHKLRLACDLNLFLHGEYVDTTEGHRPLGEYWEGLDPDCRWGGRFGDGNHYALAHVVNGVERR